MSEETPVASGEVRSLPRWKKVTFSLIILLVVAALLEGAGQLYLRNVRGYAGGPFLQYQFDPYKNIRLTPNYIDTRGVVRHNSQGFRRTGDVSREKPEGTVRIFLMGASTAYGLGGLFPHVQTEYAALDNSETIDAYLQTILQKTLPYDRVEVINASIPSIWTHHELIWLNQDILGYDPDLILFLDGWNDFYVTDPSHDQFSSYAQTEQAYHIMGPPTISSLLRMNGWWLFRKSAFVHVAIRAARDAKTILTAGPGAPPLDVDAAMENLPRVFEQNALKMIERNALILEHEGIPAIFLLQPMLILERGNLEKRPEIEQELFEVVVDWRDNYEEFMHQAAPLVAEMVESTVTPLDADFMDLTGIYSDARDQIFTDYAHLTPEGNRLLAEHVAEKVASLLLARDST